MASKKVNIDISTTANTAGAKEAAAAMDKLEESSNNVAASAESAASKVGQSLENISGSSENLSKSFFKVQSAAEQSMRAADVEAVKSKQSLDAAAAAADAYERQLAEIQSATERLVAANLADAVGKIAKAFGDLSPEANLAVSGVQNFLNVLANTGDPIKASLAVAGTAIGGVVSTMIDASNQAKELDKSQKEHAESMAAVRTKILASIKAEKMSEFFQKETDAVNAQIDALERRSKVQSAIASAQSALGGAAAPGGADPGVAEAARVNSETTAKLAEIDRQVALAGDTLAAATRNVEIANLALKEAVHREGPGGESAIAAEAKLKAAEELKAQLEKDFQDIQDISTAKTAEIVAEAQTQVDKITEQTTAQWTAGVAAIQTELQAEIDKQGASASSSMKSALEGFAAVMADGQIKPEEIAKLNTAFEQLKNSQNQFNSKVLSGLQSQNSQNVQALNQITAINNQITTKLNGAINALNNLQNRVNNLALPQR
jgi:hypothetical protein